MKIELKAPWDTRCCDDAISYLEFLIKQLEYYLPNSPNKKYMKDDLEGYKELHKTNNNELIEKFFAFKHELRTKGVKTENKKIIDIFKRKGIWPV